MSNNNSNNSTERVEISLHASKLKNVAGFGRGTSDPYAVVTLIASDSAAEQPRILGQTESLKSNLSPQWTKTFTTEFSFGKPTRINVGIYDASRQPAGTTPNGPGDPVPPIGNSKPSKKSNKPMGSAVFELGEILGSKGHIKGKKLKDGGILFCRVVKSPSVTAGGSCPTGRLHLTLRGVKLKNVDGLFGKSDPYLEISKKVRGAGGGMGSWQVVYRSEVIQNNLNPKWKPFTIGLAQLCDGNQNSPIQIVCKDYEKNGKHTPMGMFETSVKGLLNAKVHSGTGDPRTIDTSKAFKLISRKGKAFGQIVVTNAVLEDVSPPQQQQSSAQLNGTSSAKPSAEAIPLIPAMPAPAPPDFTATATAVPAPTASALPPFGQALNRPPPSNNLVNGLSDSSLPTPIAPPQTAVPQPFANHSFQHSNSNSFNEDAEIPLSYGTLPPVPPPPFAAATSSSLSRPKFVDYLSGGMELQMTVAIDFTGSNGDPRRPGTLHYIHPDGSFNDYEKAITAVSEIVARYDSDQKFPVLGFGAKYNGQIQHCFQVGPNSEAAGIKGIIDAYRTTFRTGLTMSGPTIFSQVIQVVADQARRHQEQARRQGQQFYHILLILTDGAASDIPGTVRALSAASDAPLSVVIVGVGQADFSSMQFLDDFQQQQQPFGSAPAGRDICQFVEFSKHQHNKMHLTQATLDEIPDQVVSYFHDFHSIPPLPALRGSRVAITPDEYNPDEEIDLTLEFKDDDTVQVASGGVIDGTSYGTYQNLAGGSATPQPFVPGQQSSRPQQPFVPGQQQQQPRGSVYAQQPRGSVYSQQQPRGSVYAQQSRGSVYAQQSQHPIPIPPPQQQPFFHVRVPPGIRAGQQLQIQHPRSGDPMIVSVPQGAIPGGTFAVPF